MGRGNFVGTKVLHYAKDVPEPYYYLEGDNFFYVDGEEEASWKGTGTDNFFNSDHGQFAYQPYFVQLYGCLGKQVIDGGFTNHYRFMMLDSIPFSTSLVWVNEMGCPLKFSSLEIPSNSMINCHWTSYWYSTSLDVKTITRQEPLYYYAVTKDPDTEPTENHPLIRGNTINYQLTPGTWWLHTAPIWNPDKVSHSKHEVRQQ
jgi:hypothetical protein